MINDTIPFFSVIMASYNNEKYISQSIESLLAQTYSNWELIIVDDCSSDNSNDIINFYKKNDKRIKLITLEANHGSAFARNLAIDHSKGEWLAILDSDDIYVPEKLEIQKNLIDSITNSNISLIGSDMFIITENNEIVKKISFPTESEDLKENLYNFKRFPPHSSILYKRTTFLLNNGFNPLFLRAEDYDLWIRLSNSSDFLSIQIPLIKYRITQTQNSSNKCKKNYSQFIYALSSNIINRLKKDYSINIQKSEEFNSIFAYIYYKYDSSKLNYLHKFLANVKAELLQKNYFRIIMLLFLNIKLIYYFIIKDRLIFSFIKSSLLHLSRNIIK